MITQLTATTNGSWKKRLAGRARYAMICEKNLLKRRLFYEFSYHSPLLYFLSHSSAS